MFGTASLVVAAEPWLGWGLSQSALLAAVSMVNAASASLWLALFSSSSVSVAAFSAGLRFCEAQISEIVWLCPPARAEMNSLRNPCVVATLVDAELADTNPLAVH